MATPRVFTADRDAYESVVPTTPEILPLEPGDHLDQATFHARYDAMPENVKAELIGGIVYMSSPVKPRHGGPQGEVITWLYRYKAFTSGTEAYGNISAILGDKCEPQPDAALIILPRCGGQTRESEMGFLLGPPELTAEVALSSVSIDLHAKLKDYQKAGVLEYVVVLVQEERVAWFSRRDGKFEPLVPGPDGIIRSAAFPGLWLDPAALLRRDTLRVEAVLQNGLATPEHQAFVQKLKAAGA